MYYNDINEILRIAGVKLNEREDLTKFNRIAGFYHLDTKQFELFPRTSEDISTEDDEINDYIHNVYSKDEFIEFHIVRFGIEDIPGEGVVCYIEADTKRHAEECYYAILDNYAEDCNIIKYELEYYVGNKPKYIFLNRYGDKELVESIAYASKKDLSDIVLMNPTKKELKENNMINSRCMVDSDGCWYFCDMQNMLHSNMESIFREDVFFPYYDGNDCYGIAYYDLENNEFWYNNNGDMTKQECENQYKYSDYLRTTFPNAKVVPNPYGWNDEDNDEDLNESYGRMGRPFIWNDPTYSQFHKILRDNTTYGKLSAIIDNGHIYCWDSALSHHDSVVKDIEESGIKLSDDYIWVRFKEPNLCWVSAAYFDDYTDEDLEDLPQQDFEKELEDNPIIRKYFPQGVKVVRFDRINESVEDKSKLITAYRGIDSDKFKFKNGTPQWFSSSEGIAKSFGDITFEVKLKLNNPADLTNDKELYIILKDMIKEYEENFRNRYNQIRGYLVNYIKEIYPDFDISNIDDNTLIRLSKQLKDVPYYMENNISLFNELNIMLDCISKQESWAGLFHEIIYPNWNKVIKIIQNQGYDSIISYEEASDRSYIDIGYVIWNNENIVSIKKLSKNINESVEEKILYIIRGVPGSGKSTLAHKLTDNVVEADQYFYDDKGNYNWSADKLNQAHNWCFYTVKKYMEEGRDKIAVANTFVKKRDYKRYVELAEQFGYKVDIRTCTGNYQNIHNVPDETVERMRAKFQLDESVKILNKEESDDTKLVTSPNELNQILINNNEMRVIYDKNKKWYIIGNPETSIHYDMLRDAMIDGLYTMNDGFGRMMDGTKYEDGQNYYREHKDDFIIFRTTSDINNDEEYVWDDYRYSYEYKNYCVFDRNNDFPQTTLYKILGKPIAVNYFGNDEDELDESIAYVSKKDLSDIILKNPTRKELKENGLEFCRYMFEDDNTYYFVDAKEYSHLDISQLFLDVFKNYNLHTDGGYYSVKENCFYIRNDFGCEKNKERIDNTKLLHKLFGNFKSIIYEGDYPEGYSKELDESAENDRTLRDYAVKLAIICLDALVKTKYETQFSKTAMIINVDKEFKKAVPMLKKSPYKYALSIGNKYDDSYFYYCKTKNEKFALISIPLFSKNPFDFAWDLLLKHKKMFEKICNQYEGNEQVLKFKDQAAKYAKKYIEKIISNEKSRYLNLLTHECTHLIDDLRKTKTFKTKEQKHDTIEDNKEYYNSPIEQNAYYQQTISIFDDWANQSVRYKQFNNFWDDFLRQYRGDWELLNDKNKRKLKKRAYAYWELYIKE